MTTGAGGPGRGRDGRGTADGWWFDEEEGWPGQAARGWAQADGGGPAEWPDPAWWPWAPAKTSATTATAHGESWPRAEAERRSELSSNGPRRHRGQVLLGLAVMAAERLHAGPPNDTFLTSVGLLQQGAQGAQSLARRAMSPPGRIASRALGWAARAPAMNASHRSLLQSRQRMGRIVLDARRRGEATVAAGRADASALVQATVADGSAWAQARAVPQIVDGLVSKLVDSVVAKIVDGAAAEIRARVLPVVVEELTHEADLRDLTLEQGRGVVNEAATNPRTTAAADDRVGSAFRRLVGHPPSDERAEDEAGGGKPRSGKPEGAKPGWPWREETSTAETGRE